LDFTNPATRRWWRGRVRAALDLGADGFMQDFGEETLPGMRFFDGETGATMHNRYPAVYHRATRRVVDGYERQNPGRRIFFFTRAGYSGRPGGAAYENANFPGDETTDWTRSSGIASQVPDMLNRAVGGAYGFTTDIGGYFDVYNGTPTTKELFLRWAQLAALTPFFRLHGSLIAGVHTPWSFDAQTVRLYNALSRLHDRARPLILRLWREAVRTGIPPTRPLWLAYPGDGRAARQDQEWLLGRDVLVAPVIAEGARRRTVYFPRGCWRQPVTRLLVRGPRTRTIPAPLSRLPYFVRCGTRPFATGR
jgi:alpha-D-xyloside xylohydrolase